MPTRYRFDGPTPLKMRHLGKLKSFQPGKTYPIDDLSTCPVAKLMTPVEDEDEGAQSKGIGTEESGAVDVSPKPATRKASRKTGGKK